jgi:hypothetical protein
MDGLLWWLWVHSGRVRVNWHPPAWFWCSRFAFWFHKTSELHLQLPNFIPMECNWTFQSWRCSYLMERCPYRRRVSFHEAADITTTHSVHSDRAASWKAIDIRPCFLLHGHWTVAFHLKSCKCVAKGLKLPAWVHSTLVFLRLSLGPLLEIGSWVRFHDGYWLM